MKSPVFATKLGALFQGDCLETLPAIDDESVDLVFADPPFNLGKDYGKGINDSIAEGDYLEWSAEWIRECVRVLKPGGAFYLFNLPKWNVENACILRALEMTFRHWIAIDIKLGLPIPGRLYPSHYSLLYFTKGKTRYFSRPRVPIQKCRHCKEDVKDYGGHRDKIRRSGLNLGDVWSDITPVRHRSTKFRVGNELSIKLLRRVLKISSKKGDLVLDPFGGSGTTYAAAEEMNRRWIGIELGDCQPIVERLKGEKDPKVQRNEAGKRATAVIALTR